VSGRYHYVQRRSGLIVAKGVVRNLVPLEGGEVFLKHFFGYAYVSLGVTPHRYMGLIKESGFVGIDIEDTAASHVNWVEETAYNEATRPQATDGSGTIGSYPDISLTLAPVTFSFTDNTNSVQIRGFLLSTSNVKGGSAGAFCSLSAMAEPLTIRRFDTLAVTFRADDETFA
jgi:hypothetical protein